MTSTLVNEICDDHERILGRLEQLVNRDHVDNKRIRPLLTAIGAHHLAEEDTLYDALKSHAGTSIGEAQVYHLVLDDLAYTMYRGDRSEESLEYQLRLLQSLLRHHFMIEETQLLEIVVGRFSLQQQIDLGRRYRERYGQNIAALMRSADGDISKAVELTIS